MVLALVTGLKSEQHGVNSGDRSDECPVTVLTLVTGLMSDLSRC
jgi:hypothetical protein